MSKYYNITSHGGTWTFSGKNYRDLSDRLRGDSVIDDTGSLVSVSHLKGEPEKYTVEEVFLTVNPPMYHIKSKCGSFEFTDGRVYVLSYGRVIDDTGTPIEISHLKACKSTYDVEPVYGAVNPLEQVFSSVGIKHQEPSNYNHDTGLSVGGDVCMSFTWPREKEDLISNPSHYTHLDIQPKTYIVRNKLPWWHGNAVKYCARAGHKMHEGMDKVESEVFDLNKAIENIKMRINFIQGEEEL